MSKFKIVDAPLHYHHKQWDELFKAVQKLRKGKAIAYPLHGKESITVRDRIRASLKLRKCSIHTRRVGRAILIWKKAT